MPKARGVPSRNRREHETEWTTRASPAAKTLAYAPVSNPMRPWLGFPGPCNDPDDANLAYRPPAPWR